MIAASLHALLRFALTWLVAGVLSASTATGLAIALVLPLALSVAGRLPRMRPVRRAPPVVRSGRLQYLA
ncbi:MAG TPA: hypothetical protein PKC88_00805 [Plasticicumulans sp.]|nr:hypothetical protein [Plasticicumulans sp.]